MERRMNKFLAQLSSDEDLFGMAASDDPGWADDELGADAVEEKIFDLAQAVELLEVPPPPKAHELKAYQNQLKRRIKHLEKQLGSLKPSPRKRALKRTLRKLKRGSPNKTAAQVRLDYQCDMIRKVGVENMDLADDDPILRQCQAKWNSSTKLPGAGSWLAPALRPLGYAAIMGGAITAVTPVFAQAYYRRQIDSPAQALPHQAVDQWDEQKGNDFTATPTYLHLLKRHKAFYAGEFTVLTGLLAVLISRHQNKKAKTLP